jgi:CDP-6-deoxy-D-xylo-4-hexulose-3-dehydrase
MSGAIGLAQIKKLPAMTEARRSNLKLFQSLFAQDRRFIIQKEHGKSSSFSFTIILNPDCQLDRTKVFRALKDAEIGFRIITGGCILRHDVIKYYDYEVIGDLKNAMIAHDHGFFVGNHPTSLTPQIEKLYEVLDTACSS